MSGLVSTLEGACATFCTYNGVKKALKTRNISNGLEITNNLRQNRGVIAICVFLGLFRRRKTRALCFACKLEWKGFIRRNISNGIEITINLLQNPRMIASCVSLGLFWSWKARVLRSARTMHWKKRLNVKLFQEGEKNRLIFFKIHEWLRLACVRACFDAGKPLYYVLHL